MCRQLKFSCSYSHFLNYRKKKINLSDFWQKKFLLICDFCDPGPHWIVDSKEGLIKFITRHYRVNPTNCGARQCTIPSSRQPGGTRRTSTTLPRCFCYPPTWRTGNYPRRIKYNGENVPLKHTFIQIYVLAGKSQDPMLKTVYIELSAHLMRPCTGQAAPSARAQMVCPSICLESSHSRSISSTLAFPSTAISMDISLTTKQHCCDVERHCFDANPDRNSMLLTTRRISIKMMSIHMRIPSQVCFYTS